MPTVCAAVKLMWKFCESFKCETHALNTTGPAWRLSAPVSRPHTNSRSSQHPQDQLILEVRFKKPQFQLQYLNSKYGLQSGLGSHFDVCVQDPVVVSARRYSIFFKTHYDPTFLFARLLRYLTSPQKIRVLALTSGVYIVSWKLPLLYF